MQIQIGKMNNYLTRKLSAFYRKHTNFNLSGLSWKWRYLGYVLGINKDNAENRTNYCNNNTKLSNAVDKAMMVNLWAMIVTLVLEEITYYKNALRLTQSFLQVMFYKWRLSMYVHEKIHFFTSLIPWSTCLNDNTNCMWSIL